ncbi:MAG TPA: potassium channel family protein [Stellaceae bacterium]
MRRTAIHTWQDRLRDPSLSVLLILELGVVFVAVPLAAQGLPTARAIGETIVLAVVVIVGALSHRRGALLVILVGLGATFASVWLRPDLPTVAESLLSRGGSIMTFSALSWDVAHAVYAPGRITFQRLQGAFVLYLNRGTIFASAFHLIWDLSPGAFTNVGTPARGPSEIALMLYFSFTTLTSTGFGDIVPVNPFARSLANLEAVLGQLYLATTVARLVTLELADRRRERL